MAKSPLGQGAAPLAVGAAALWVVCAVLPGCRSAQEREQRAEIAQLVDLFDRVQGSPRGERDRPLANLANAACTMDAACTFRKQCVDAYTTLNEVEHTLSELGARSTKTRLEAADVWRKLQTAEQRLQTSQELADECVEQRGVLARRYDVR